MASLGPTSTSLIRAGRRALRPTAADRERIEGALRARLGAEALVPDAHPPASPVAPAVQRAAGPLAAKTVAAALIAGGGLYFALAPSRPSTPHTPVAPASATVEPVTPAADAAGEPRTAAPVEPGTNSASPRAHPHRNDRLAQEVSLLSQATSALKAGRTVDALRVLDAHQRRFPAGILTEERRAAKAQALCVLGRLRDGRAELSHLAPRSPAAIRAGQVCDSVAPEETPSVE